MQWSLLALYFFFFPDITYASDTENLIQNVLQTNPRGCTYAKTALYILFTSLAEEWYDINYWFRDPISALVSDTCSFELPSSGILKKNKIKKENLRKFWAEITIALYYCHLSKQAQLRALTLGRQVKVCMQIFLAELATRAENTGASGSYWRCHMFTLTAPHLLFRLLLFISLVGVELLPRMFCD